MITILKSGFYTTIQDLGRFGYRNKGVPVSGVMDEYSAINANLMLGNDKNDVVFEMTMLGATFLFSKATYIAISGAKIEVLLNNKPISTENTICIAAGDILALGRMEKGFRSYLAIKNGLLVPTVLGSCSYYTAITNSSSISKGDVFEYQDCKTPFPKNISNYDTSIITADVLEVYKGPEFTLLSDQQLSMLFARQFSVSKDNNRMAYQIKETITSISESILTSATLPGTVQLTPQGKLIVLMKDGQTTGGYARILQLSKKAIAVLAQKKTGENFSLKLIV